MPRKPIAAARKRGAAAQKKRGATTKTRGAVAKKEWVVTISGDRPIGAIARDLGTAGLTKQQVLKEIGSITGAASEKDVAKLRKVRGVADVSPSEPIDIGPPSSDKTW